MRRTGAPGRAGGLAIMAAMAEPGARDPDAHAADRPRAERDGRARAVAVAGAAPPIQGFFDRAARRVGRSGPAPGSVDHLAALAAATPQDLAGARARPRPRHRHRRGGAVPGPRVPAAPRPRRRRLPRDDPDGAGEGRPRPRRPDRVQGRRRRPTLPFDDESFDLVTQVNVPPFFAEIARVLRPGGHVIVVASRRLRDAVLHARRPCSSAVFGATGSIAVAAARSARAAPTSSPATAAE